LIGSGGSGGREGPIIQIGAAFGSTLGQLIAMLCDHR
jgi:chloride channel protein, CIC family